MINNVAFTGREAMLGKITPVSAAEQLAKAKKASLQLAKQIEDSYTGVGKHYSKAEIANAKALAEKAEFLVDAPTMADRIASYEASHQLCAAPVAKVIAPEVKTAPKTVNVEHIDFFA